MGDGGKSNESEDDRDERGARDEDDDDRPPRTETRWWRRPRVRRRRASRTKWRPDSTRGTAPESRSAWWRPRVCAAPLSRENHRPPVPSPPPRSRPPPRTGRRLPSCKRTRATVIVSCRCRVRQWPLWHARAARTAPLLALRSGSAHSSRPRPPRAPLEFPLRV